MRHHHNLQRIIIIIILLSFRNLHLPICNFLFFLRNPELFVVFQSSLIIINGSNNRTGCLDSRVKVADRCEGGEKIRCMEKEKKGVRVAVKVEGH